MAANKRIIAQFDYGDSVMVKSNAPNKYNPGNAGAVCGVTIIDTEKLSNNWGYKLNTIIYFIEFSNKLTVNIPEEYLEKI